ncbi:potassium channel family protein [Gordonia aurantiaca]|uniref:potassium channel family protein n=1 Tax=Gordonia sp. B21 TaxID=3151852 RepID=UPI003265EC77
MDGTAVSSGREQYLAKWEQKAEWPLAVVAVVFMVAYSVEILGDPSDQARQALDWTMAVSWLAFAVDYVVRLAIAPQRGRWFVQHLLDLAIVVLPVLRPLRLLRLLMLVSALQRAIGTAIRGRVAIYTACSAILLIYAASLAIYETERNIPGSSITSFGDALWWAIATVTTVGYGDYAPVTTSGRIIAACLMIGGISIIGVVTATIASWIVQRVAEEDDANAAATREQIETLRAEIQDLRALILEVSTSTGTRSSESAAEPALSSPSGTMST